jgi:phosphoribosylformylglycinamidine synthase
MASKGNLGIKINLNKVPCREANMTPYEIMLSESQERMLIVLENGKEDLAKKIFDKWNLDFAVIGKTTNTKNIELFFDNNQVANIPVNTLVENSPMYDRKWKKSKLPKKNKIKKETLSKLKIKDVLKKILSNPNVCSKEWIWQQYDHTVMGDTIQKPGGDSGVVRIHGTKKAVAASVDSSAVYCWAHPLTGGKQIVAESWRNLISVGATPIAITNCLNFGSPENEDNMGEFVECVQGIGEASKYLNFPVVSGNVSFYNQTKEIGIKPTPSIGGVGLIKDYKKWYRWILKKLIIWC